MQKVMIVIQYSTNVGVLYSIWISMQLTRDYFMFYIMTNNLYPSYIFYLFLFSVFISDKCCFLMPVVQFILDSHKFIGRTKCASPYQHIISYFTVSTCPALCNVNCAKEVLAIMINNALYG